MHIDRQTNVPELIDSFTGYKATTTASETLQLSVRQLTEQAADRQMKLSLSPRDKRVPAAPQFDAFIIYRS